MGAFTPTFTGQVPNNAPFNDRLLIDNNYVVSVALATAGSAASTNALNLLNAVPYPVTQYVIAEVFTSGSANGANSKNVNVVLQHTTANSDGTANGSAWANIPQLANPLLRVQDNANAGYNTGNTNVLLPPNVLQFIRASSVTEANGGNPANGGSLTLRLRF